MLGYAWFVQNARVTATDVTVTAQTAYSLLIKRHASGTYGTTTPLLSDKVNLIPVSTVGGNAQDGIKFYKSDKWDKDANVYTFADATVTNTDATDTSDLVSEKYISAANLGSPYYVDTVYFKAGQTSNLYFDADMTGLTDKNENGEQQTTNITKFSASDNELVKAMRIGVLVSKPDGTEGKFYVFQLNSTPSTNKANTTATNLIGAGADGLRAGTDSTTTTALFTTDNIATFKNNTLPTLDASAVSGSANALATATANSVALYNFSVTGTNDKAECKAVIYIWMEGCDYDTVAANTNLTNGKAFKDFASKIQLGFCVGTTYTP